MLNILEILVNLSSVSTEELEIPTQMDKIEARNQQKIVFSWCCLDPIEISGQNYILIEVLTQKMIDFVEATFENEISNLLLFINNMSHDGLST